ncbi:MAG TPA: YjbH domain-containing protein [Prevotellaceae bacterium]|nr:YjbH domain-containing protein [Prevotellaceae bacterium]
MKKLVSFFLLSLLIGVATSCSNGEESAFVNADCEKSTDVICCFDLSKYINEISSLDSLESIDIPIKLIGCENLNKNSYTRAGEITPIVGTVTNLGNLKTFFKYGVGENLVPSYYCGPNLNYMTISTVYKVSVRYELNDNYEVKGFVGEKSGWNGTYINNPQIRWQGKTGDTNYTELYTFAYDIKSTYSGQSAGEHCWVPLNVNDVRIYAKILQ